MGRIIVKWISGGTINYLRDIAVYVHCFRKLKKYCFKKFYCMFATVESLYLYVNSVDIRECKQ